MERKVNVVIIEFLPVMGEILKSTLNELNNVEVAGLANDYNEGKELINQLRPDFLVCDYNPHNLDSLELIASFRVAYPDMKIIIITGFDVSDHIYNLIDMKVNGVIDKASTINHLRASLKCALNNQFIVPIPYISELLSGNRKGNKVALTTRDIDIMKMVSEDKTREEIASYISVSKRSIDNYLRLIYKKLGCSNRMEAVGIFARSNIE
jgi:two-component system competent response regulator ComA